MMSCQQVSSGLVSILSIRGALVHPNLSLYPSGIFPSKCALVPPREITKEELLMVSKRLAGQQVYFREYIFCFIISDSLNVLKFW